MAALKVTGNYLNPYEQYHDSLRNKFGYDEKLWATQVNRGEQDINFYVQTLIDSDKIDQAKFNEEWRTDLLDSEEKFSLIANELYADRTELKDRKGTTLNDLGQEIETDLGEMTDYDYTKYLMKQRQDYLVQKQELDLMQEAKDKQKWYEKVWNGIVGISGDAVRAMADIVDSIPRSIDAFIDGTTAAINGGSFDESFRATMKDSEAAIFDNLGLQEAIMEWQRKYSPTVNVYGENEGGFWGIMSGVSYSLGLAVPSMLLNKAGAAVAKGGASLSAINKLSTSLYYGGMAAISLDELINDPTYATVPVWKLALNSTVRTGVEFAIQKGLSKVFGSSQLDRLTFGENMKSSFANVSAKHGLARIVHDFLHEGTEELLQTFSNGIVNNYFAIVDEEFRDTESFNIMTLIDAFFLGGIATIGGNIAAVAKAYYRSYGSKKYSGGIPKMNPLKNYDFQQRLIEMNETLEEISHAKSSQARDEAFAQMYIAYRAVADVYSNMGEARIANAAAMLKRLSAYKPISDDTIVTAAKRLMANFGDIRNQVLLKENFKKYKMSGELIDYQSGDDNAIKATYADIESKVKALITKGINRVHVMQHGTNSFVVGDQLYVPIKYLRNADTNTIYRTVAEERLIRNTATDKSLRPVLERVTETYKKVTGIKNVTDEEVVTNLYFNEQFQKILLATANKDVYDLLAHLKSTAESATADTKLDAIYKKRINDAMRNLKKNIIEYLINQQQAEYEHLSMLTKKEAEFIRNKRYSKDLRNRVLNLDKVSDQEWSYLNDRINYLPVSDELKNRLKNDIKDNSKATRANAFRLLENYYYGLFNTLYDNKTYLAVNTWMAAMFNEFLHTNNVTIATLTQVPDQDVTADEAILHWRKTFNDFTDGRYDFLYNNGKIEIHERGKADRASWEKINTDLLNVNNDFDERTIVVQRQGAESLVKSVLNNSLSNIAKANTSVSQVILNPKQYLSEDMQQAILKDPTYGNLSPQSVFLYLRQHFLQKTDGNITIVAMQNGQFQFVDVKPMKSVLVEHVVKPSEDSTKISDYINGAFLKGKLADTKVVLSDRTYYSDTENTLYIDRRSTELEFQFALLHEFQHAIQAEYGMNFGLNYDWLTILPKTLKNKIVSDIKAHRPALFKQNGKIVKGKDAENIASSYIYVTTGETEAFGLTGMQDVYNVFPTVIRLVGNNVSELTTPWGTTYKISGDLASLQIENSKGSLVTLLDTNSYLEYATLTELHRNEDGAFYNPWSLNPTKEERANFEEIQRIYNDNFNPAAINEWHNAGFALTVNNELKQDVLKEISEHKNAYRKMAWKAIAPWISYEKFLEMDIPFVRYQGSENKYNNAQSVILGANYETVLSQITYEANKKGHLLYGTVKGKDLLGFMPFNEFEAFVSAETIANAKTVPVKRATYLGTNYYVLDADLIQSSDVSASMARPMSIVEIKTNSKADEWYKSQLSEELTPNALFAVVLPDGYLGYNVDHWSLDQLQKDANTELNDSVDGLDAYNASTIAIETDGGIGEDFYNSITIKVNSNDITNAQYNSLQKLINEVLAKGGYVSIEHTPTKLYITSEILRGAVDADTLLRRFMSNVKIDDTPAKTKAETKTEAKTENKSIKDVETVVKKGIEKLSDEEKAARRAEKLENRQRVAELQEEINSTVYKKRARKTNEERYWESKGQPSRPRYISNKVAAESNLKYFIRKNKPIQMNRDVASFIAHTDETKLESALWNKIGGKQAGTLTRSDIYRFVHDAKRVNDYTYELLNKYIFKNKRIRTFSQLKYYTEMDAARYYAMRAILKSQGDTKIIRQVLTHKQFDETINDLLRNEEFAKKYFAIVNRYNEYKGRELDIKPNDLRLPFLKYFDGTIDSAAYAAAITKVVEIASTEGNWEKQFSSQGTVSEDTGIGGKGDNLTLADTFTTGKSIEDEFIEREVDDISVSEMTESIVEYTREQAEFNNIPFDESAFRKQLEKKSIDVIRALYNSEEIATFANKQFTAEQVGKIIDGKVTVKQSDIRPRKVVMANVKRLAATIKNNLSNKDWKRFLKVYGDLFDADHNLVKSNYEGADYDTVVALEERLKQAARDVRQGVYTSVSNIKLKERVSTLEAKNKKLKEQKKRKPYEKKATVTEYKIGDIVYQVEGNVEMPDVVKKLFSIVNENFVETDVTHISGDNELHMEADAKQFYEANAETLGSLTDGQIADIVNFFTNGKLINAGTLYSVRYNAYMMYTLAYILDNHYNGIWTLTDQQVNDIKTIIGRTASAAGTTLAAFRSVISKIDPNREIIASLAKSVKLTFDEEYIDRLAKSIKKRSPQEIQAAIDALVQNAVDKWTETNGQKTSRDARHTLLEKLWKLERVFMLSSPGTAIRNVVSNTMVGIGNEAGTRLGNFVWKKHKKGQYVFNGTQTGLAVKNRYVRGKGFVLEGKVNVDTPVAKFVKEYFIDKDMISLIADGLSKYDVRKTKHRPENVLTEMIVNNIEEQIFQNTTFKNKGLNWVHKTVFKMLSDAPWVNKQAMIYFAKMLTEDGTDLSKGYSTEVLNAFAEAYKLAAYNYMHRSNFWNSAEEAIRQRGGETAFFIYKQVLPFSSAGWNWFLEGLNYGPVGLIKGLVQLTRLEKTIDRVEELRQKGENVPSSRFSEYLAKRTLGKGIIGTFLLGLGIVLGVTGVAGVDEEDDKIKIKIGNVKVDISNLFGTSSVFLGIALTNPYKNDDKDFFSNLEDFIYNVTDVLFLDSTLSDIFASFQYSQSFGEWAANMPMNFLQMYIPNALKAFNRLLYNHEVSYSPGILGDLQRYAVNLVPGLAYAMPRKIDPYTGATKTKYNLPFLTEFFNTLSPVKFEDWQPSDIEKTAIELGLRKGELTGRYDDIGELNIAEKELLNKKYGELNKKDLEELMSNRVKYEVEMPNGKKKELRYSQMTNEQRKSVINRIMTNNARIAKIYVYTEKRGTYYATDAEYKNLRKLGIIKNVYKETGRKKGFI